MIVGWCCGLLLLQTGQAPAALTATAGRLRRSGAEVTISKVHGPWEIWLESNRPISDRSLAIVRSAPGLASIRLLEGGFGDAGVLHFRDLPDLKVLVLRSRRITDGALVGIAKLPSLTKLDLMGAKLSAAGLQKLESLPTLQELYLHGAEVREADLSVLGRLKRLRKLSLPVGTSPACRSRLRAALPGCQILELD